MRLLYQYTTFMPPVNLFRQKNFTFLHSLSCSLENLPLYALSPLLRGDFFLKIE